MKCLTCLHYDVVKFECSQIAEKLDLIEDSVQVDPNWGCKEYTKPTAKAVSDKLTIDVTVRI